jgi:predicted nuclease of predicted toxin-antitoxin system
VTILVDMNLSPDWVPWLARHGFQAIHWSTVGDPRAPDTALMAWAEANDAVVFTHDLDFGNLLAATSAAKPSVVQIRSQDTFPDVMGPGLVDSVRRFAAELAAGALVVVEPHRSRVRIPPI